MKSYINHIKATANNALLLKNRPIMRSSAIFPIRVNESELDTIVTFLGYWMIKRKITEVTVVMTLRDKKGSLINLDTFLVDEVKSYSWSMKELLEKNLISTKDFIGSIEIEIFSSRNMVFPYPAITFAYKSDIGLAFVHSCGRVYNDFYDQKNNEEQIVPETGFDIIPNINSTAFFSFINGTIPIINEKIDFVFINSNGDSFKSSINLTNINCYETVWIDLFKSSVKRNFFKGEKGTVKIFHNRKGFFPRFVAGNQSLSNKNVISLTHSYYDTSGDKSDTSIWKNPNRDQYYDSVLSFPIDEQFNSTIIATYPNMVMHKTILNLEFYDSNSNLIYTLKDSFSIFYNKNNAINYIDCKKILDKNAIILKKNSPILCKVIFNGDGYVPSRMKFGLNFSNSKDISLSSNICFNAVVPNKNFELKSGTFKWLALFDPSNQKVFLTNSSFVKNQNKVANADIEIWRKKDNRSYKFKISINENSCKEIISNITEDLNTFLGGSIGWITIKSDNPNLYGYYVTDYNNGLVGADHFY